MQRRSFPRLYYFGRFRYWRLDELEAWEREQALKAQGKYAGEAA